MIIRPATPDDAAEIADIYNHYILTSHATFEIEAIDSGEMEERLRDSIENGYPFLASENEGRIIGYAYARGFRPRPGYRHAVEVAIYTRIGFERRGIGFSLYTSLIRQLFGNGFHTIIATISLPNDASVRLHEKLGFRKVGHFREVGRKFDRWIDVGYWQLTQNGPD